MKEISDKNFGPLIAFCLPGFILLLALTYSFPEVKGWISTAAPKDGVSIGGFLYSTLASLSLGLLLSALRWATVDQCLQHEHWIFGRPLPNINFDALRNKDTLSAFAGVIENHYRYYQYYSNSLLAVEVGLLTYLCKVGNLSRPQWSGAAFIAVILFAASRDCYRKFRIRGAAVTTEADNDERLGQEAQEGEKGEEGKERREEDGQTN